MKHWSRDKYNFAPFSPKTLENDDFLSNNNTSSDFLYFMIFSAKCSLHVKKMNKKHFTRRGPMCAPGYWADIGKRSDFLTRELVENYREPSRLSRSIFVIPETFTTFVFFWRMNPQGQEKGR